MTEVFTIDFMGSIFKAKVKVKNFPKEGQLISWIPSRFLLNNLISNGKTIELRHLGDRENFRRRGLLQRQNSEEQNSQYLSSAQNN